MAAYVREMLYQYGLGLGFLATVRSDRGPRLHPICPVITDEGLFAFIVPSPERRDLDRDGRFALDAFASEEVDDECYLAGTVRAADVFDERAGAARAYHLDPRADETLYEFDIERRMVARYRHGGDWPRTYSRWIDSHR